MSILEDEAFACTEDSYALCTSCARDKPFDFIGEAAELSKNISALGAEAEVFVPSYSLSSETSISIFLRTLITTKTKKRNRHRLVGASSSIGDPQYQKYIPIHILSLMAVLTSEILNALKANTQ
jgi:hypothetical protein